MLFGRIEQILLKGVVTILKNSVTTPFSYSILDSLKSSSYDLSHSPVILFSRF